MEGHVTQASYLFLRPTIFKYPRGLRETSLQKTLRDCTKPAISAGSGHASGFSFDLSQAFCITGGHVKASDVSSFDLCKGDASGTNNTSQAFGQEQARGHHVICAGPLQAGHAFRQSNALAMS
jgi:hypothetical protein